MGCGGRGEREIIYLSLHCYHQNDSYIKVGSDDSRSEGQSYKTRGSK